MNKNYKKAFYIYFFKGVMRIKQYMHENTFGDISTQVPYSKKLLLES